jgi:hypothetical protein
VFELTYPVEARHNICDCVRQTGQTQERLPTEIAKVRVRVTDCLAAYLNTVKMLVYLKYVIVVVLYLIVSIDAINCKGCVPLDIFTFDKVGFCPAFQCPIVFTYLFRTVLILLNKKIRTNDGFYKNWFLMHII